MGTRLGTLLDLLPVRSAHPLSGGFRISKADDRHAHGELGPAGVHPLRHALRKSKRYARPFSNCWGPLLAEIIRAVKRAPIRVESETSLHSRDAVLEVLQGIMRAKDLPLVNATEYGITEVTGEELAAHGTKVVLLRRGGHIA